MTHYGIRPRFLVGLVAVFVALGVVVAIKAFLPATAPVNAPPAATRVAPAAIRALAALPAPAPFRRQSVCASPAFAHDPGAACFVSVTALPRTNSSVAALVRSFGFTLVPATTSCIWPPRPLGRHYFATCEGGATSTPRHLTVVYTLSTGRRHIRADGLTTGTALNFLAEGP